MKAVYLQDRTSFINACDRLNAVYDRCTLCGHLCNVDRNQTVGVCGLSTTVKVALFKPFFYEEPPLSGSHGAGNVFFSGCNLHCVYCQNYTVSQAQIGAEITVDELADIFLFLQNTKKVHNINLVTPTPFLPSIAEAVRKASEQGLELPIVYNCNGYENPDIIALIASFCDIFLPDFKYADEQLAIQYSGAEKYPALALDTIEKMYHAVGVGETDDQGILRRGIIIRHLVLPGHLDNTKEALKQIRDRLGKYIPISLMAQFTPIFKACEFNEINRKLSQIEYDEITAFFLDLGFENGYFQSLESAVESYIPEFYGDRVQLFSQCRV